MRVAVLGNNDNGLEGIKIGMSARMSVELGPSAATIAIPINAVSQHADGATVTIVDAGTGTMQERPVKVGATTPTGIEVTAGLQGWRRARDPLTPAARYAAHPKRAPPRFARRFIAAIASEDTAHIPATVGSPCVEAAMGTGDQPIRGKRNSYVVGRHLRYARYAGLWRIHKG